MVTLGIADVGRIVRRISIRTAVYGPVRTVVWEEAGRKARPYPDFGGR